ELRKSIDMGAFCCCPCGGEFEEYPSNSIYRRCICLRFFFHQLSTGYGAMFHRIEGRTVSPSIQGATFPTSSTGTVLPDICLNDARQSLSRPLPYDPEQRFSRLQRDGLVSRREKSITHFQEESQPLRRNMSSSGIENMGSGKNWDGVESTEILKIGHSMSSDKVSLAKAALGLVQPSLEDEDVCPTCLDDYTPDNPKITTRCSHHFHLGCIYEWMERSDSCPICGKVKTSEHRYFQAQCSDI
ncbi:hypothetical protein RJ640_011753, partial [Escallonia rubra]